MTNFGPVTVAGWNTGETISVYLLDGANRRVGTPVTTSVVDDDGTVSFTGLAAESNFEGTDGTTTGRFSTLTGPDRGGGGGGVGSLLFAQADASLTASFGWRAPAAAHLVTATLTVADAVEDDVDVIDVVVNGETAVTLSLDDGETESTTSIDVNVAEGDRVGVVRVALDGGACQVQLDRGA